MGERGQTYVRSPNNEELRQVNLVFMRVCGL